MLPKATVKPTSIETAIEPFGVEVKRCYLPVVINVVCPTCGKALRHDLRDHYLSYPAFNAVESVHIMCMDRESGDECTEIEVRLKIMLNVEVIESEEKS